MSIIQNTKKPEVTVTTLIWGAIILIAFLIVLALFGFIEAGIVTGTATAVLAGLTYVSITQSKDIIDEMKKNREHPSVIALIAHVIDPFRSKLTEERIRLEEVTDPDSYISFPSHISEGFGPSEREINEIATRYPEFSEHYDSYEDLLETYDQNHSTLLDDTASYIESEFLSQLEESTIDGLENIVQESNREFEDVDDFLQSKNTVRQMNTWVFRGIGGSGPGPWQKFGELISEEELLAIRDSDEFAHRFENLEQLCQQALKLNNKMSLEVTNARGSWMDEYEVFESVVNKEKIEMPDDLRLADARKNG